MVTAPMLTSMHIKMPLEMQRDTEQLITDTFSKMKKVMKKQDVLKNDDYL